MRSWSARQRCGQSRHGEVHCALLQESSLITFSIGSAGGRHPEVLGNPVGDIVALDRAVIDFAMFDREIVRLENMQLPLGAVDRLLVGAMGIFDWNLTIARPMGDEEGHGDLLYDTVETHRGRPLHEALHVGLAEHPHHMVPVVRYRILTFALQATLLQPAPVMIGTHGRAQGESFLERGRAWSKIASE